MDSLEFSSIQWEMLKRMMNWPMIISSRLTSTKDLFVSARHPTVKEDSPDEYIHSIICIILIIITLLNRIRHFKQELPILYDLFLTSTLIALFFFSCLFFLIAQLAHHLLCAFPVVLIRLELCYNLLLVY